MIKIISRKMLVGFLLSAALLVSRAFAVGDDGSMPQPLLTAADESALNLVSIDAESDDLMSLANIRFDKKPGWTTVGAIQEHSNYLQIVLPNTIVANPGEFYDGHSPYVKKIAAFQLTPRSTGVRFFTTESAAKTKLAMTLEVLGKRVVVTIDHAQMQKLLAVKPPLKPLTTRAINETASSDAVIVAANAVEPKAGDLKVMDPKTKDPNAAAKEQDSADGREGVPVAAMTDFAAVYQSDVVAPKKPVIVPSENEVVLPATVAPAVVASAAIGKKSETPIGQDEIPALDPQATAAAVKLAEAVIANTEVNRDIEEPAALLKTPTQAPPVNAATAALPPKFGSQSPDLRSRLIQISIFSGVMLMMLVVLWLVKPYLRKRGLGAGQESIISMRTLATLPLAAKQKISLIQVGDEQILLGITPENVTFITTIKSGASRGQNQPNFTNQHPTGQSLPSLQSLGLPTANQQQGNSFAKFLNEPEVEALELQPSPFNKLQETSQTPTVARPPRAQLNSKPAATNQPVSRPQTSTRATNPQQPLARTPQTATASTMPRKSSSTPMVAGKRPPNQVAISIGEDGITDHRAGMNRDTGAATSQNQDGQKAIDDVTKMIREKLKSLRSI